MERKSMCNSLKDHSICDRACNNNSNNNNNNNNKKQVRDPWNYNRESYNGDDYLSGFSWPPRSYTCSFCKREFRSAQALGGHMNVHRRDRARLRQSPPRDSQCPTLNLNLNPNPNPNPCFSSSFTSTLPSLVSAPLAALSSPSFGSTSEIKKWDIDAALLDHPMSPKASDLTKMGTRNSVFGEEVIDGFKKPNGCKILKKAEIVRLDLEIGLVSDSKEDLDLELRLGYA